MNSKTLALDHDIKLGITSYELIHLAEHIYHSENTALLYQLVTSDIWLSLSTNFESSRLQYFADIEWSYRGIEAQVRSSLAQDEQNELAKPLSYLTILSWLSAYLKQSGGILHHDILEALTRLGEGEQALRRATMIPDPIRQAAAFIWIGFGAHETRFHQIADKAWKKAQELINQTPLDFYNELFDTKALLASILARIGDTEWAVSLVQEVDAEIRNEIDHAGGVMSSNHYALARAWASIEDIDRSFDVASEPTDIENRLFAICEAAEIQFINSKSVSPKLFKKALSLQFQVTEEKSLKRLSEVLPLCGHIDQAIKLSEKEKLGNQIWILRSGLAFALAQGDNAAIEAIKTQIFEEINQISNRQNRLRICSNLVLGYHRDSTGPNLTNLLPIIREDFDNYYDEIDNDTLGRCALALILMEDSERAQKAVEKALQVELSPDDWDETYTLIDFARLFGNAGDAKRLQEVLVRAERGQDIWQLGEIFVAVTEAASKFGNDEIFSDAKEALFKITSDLQTVAERPNVLGALAIWHRNQTNDPQHSKVRGTIQQTLDLLKKDKDDADAIAYLGLTLAQNNMPIWAKHVLSYTIQSLRKENDPNTIARVMGTASHVAALLSDKDVLYDLRKISNTIDDEWLQAEGLFWIAGWWAYLGDAEYAQKLFLQAVEYGAWDEISPDDIQQAWATRKKANQLLRAANYIGWPSTKVAVIFSELAILLSNTNPQPWHIEFGLDAIDTIPEEYSEKRALCIGMMVDAAIDNLANPQKEITSFYLAALRQARNRHTGEFWASFRSCLPYLIDKFGNSMGEIIWDDMSKIYFSLS